jgi:hypothetical protein
MNWKLLDQPLGTIGMSGGFAPRKKRAIPLAVPIASAAIGALGKLFGASKSASAERERQRMLQTEKAKSDAHYRRLINQSFLDTASGQNWMRMATDAADRIFKQEAGATAVTGRTPAADAIAKEKRNDIIGEAIANGEAQEAMRKDNLEASKRAADAQFAQQEMEAAARKRDNMAEIGQGVADTFFGIAGNMFGGTKLGQTMFSGSPAAGGGATPGDMTRSSGVVDAAPVATTQTNLLENMGLGPKMFQHQAPQYDLFLQNLKNKDFAQQLVSTITSYYNR